MTAVLTVWQVLAQALGLDWLIRGAALAVLALSPMAEGPVPADCPVVQPVRGGPTCPVPEGEVLLCRADASDQCERTRVPAFLLDLTEVTVGRFAACVAAGGCPVSEFDDFTHSEFCNYGAPGRSGHPMNCVDYRGARAYCRWVGAQLPDRGQWQRAARGDEDRAYPWGSAAPDCDCARFHSAAGRGCGTMATAAAGSLRAGRGPFGHGELAGNVHEWTSTLFSACDRENKSAAEILADDEASRFTEGGSFADGPRVLANHFVTFDEQGTRHVGMGFRCARPLPAPQKVNAAPTPN